MEQHHRIHPAGHGHKDALAAPKEMAHADDLPDVVDQISHARMVPKDYKYLKRKKFGVVPCNSRHEEAHELLP
jgi:hypothetical protein